MGRFAYVLMASSTGILGGCGPDNTPPARDDYAERIVGKWEMVEDCQHTRNNAPIETLEFTKAGGFVMRMNVEVEMEGRFHIENGKLMLTHIDGQSLMGDPATIKHLDAHLLILRSATGKDTEFVRK